MSDLLPQFQNPRLTEIDPEYKESILAHKMEWDCCSRCPIGECPERVFFKGRIPADILLVGEAVGDTEVGLGVPFIGPAGKYLRYMLNDASSRFDPEGEINWAYTNAIICSPYNPSGKLRTPKTSEIKNCTDRLLEFVNLVNPLVVISLGRVAEQAIKNMRKEDDMEGYVEFYHAMHPSGIMKQGDRGALDRKRAVHVFETAVRYVYTPW